MKRMMIAAAAMSLAWANTAFAAQQDFVIVNHTGQAIMTLNVSPTEENEWGPDILGVDILAANERAEINFADDDDRCAWDIRVTYEDGSAGAWQAIDLCSTTVVELS